MAESDLEWLLDLRRETSEFLGDNDYISEAAQKAWFDRIKNDPSVRYFIVRALDRKDDEYIGLARITHIDTINRSACVGADICVGIRGKGYGTATMNSVVAYCFEVLNLRRLWLLVLETNKRARRVYEKCGFSDEGVQKEAIWRDGKYVDYVMMSLIRKESEWSSSPPPSR